MFAKDAKFYNDGDRVSNYATTLADFKSTFERNATSGLPRELVKESLEVYLLPDFGAMEIGSHRFIHAENS